MREFIYISAAKLGQFEISRGIIARWLSKVSAKLKSPVAELEIEASNPRPTSDSFEKLREIEEDIYGAAKWWEEDSVSAGDWIQFERRMSYHIVDPAREGGAEVVLFLDDSDRQVRLLLYGSTKHMLTGSRGEGSFARSIGGSGGGSEPSAVTVAASAVLESKLSWLAKRLYRSSGASKSETIALMYRQAEGDSEYEEFDSVSDRVDFRGLARVSHVFHLGPYDVIAATPLFVEYSRE